MITDLGQNAHLAILVTNSAGAAADVTTMVATVTLPDATTVTPTVTHGTTGNYSIDYPTVQAGRHRINWVGTGGAGAPYAYTDVLNVWPADPRFLISLDDAKRALRWGNLTFNAADPTLRLFIAAVTPVIEDITGALTPQTWTETYDGGGTQIGLIHAPVTSVSSVIESYGTFQRTLTAQDIFTGSGGDAYGYTIEKTTGVLTRRVSGVASRFMSGLRNIQVIYSAGLTSIPANILAAAEEELRFLWQNGQQGPNGIGAPDEAPLAWTPSHIAVPRRVIELCGSQAHAIPGIA